MNYPTTVEAAYAILDQQRAEIPAIPGMPEEMRTYLQAVADRAAVTAAINKIDNDGVDWRPDWNDNNQRKWYIWAWVKATADDKAGSGFSVSSTACVRVYSDVGSRLSFKTQNGAYYAFKQFEALYITTKLR